VGPKGPKEKTRLARLAAPGWGAGAAGVRGRGIFLGKTWVGLEFGLFLPGKFCTREGGILSLKTCFPAGPPGPGAESLADRVFFSNHRGNQFFPPQFGGPGLDYSPLKVPL